LSGHPGWQILTLKPKTIRSFDPELVKAMEEMSRNRQWSLNQVATCLMRKGLGMTTEAEPQLIGKQLDAYWGAWSEQEARDFEARVEEVFGFIDEENWH